MVNKEKLIDDRTPVRKEEIKKYGVNIYKDSIFQIF